MPYNVGMDGCLLSVKGAMYQAMLKSVGGVNNCTLYNRDYN